MGILDLDAVATVHSSLTGDRTTLYRTAPILADVLPTTWRMYAFGGFRPQQVAAYHYPDLASFAAAVPPARPGYSAQTKGRPDESAWDITPNTARTCATPSMTEALRMAAYGWPAGADRAIKARAGLEADMPKVKAIARYDVAGAVPSVPRAIAGNPVHMRRMAPLSRPRGATVTLVCHVNAPGGTKPQDMENNAVALSAVVDMLEAGNIRCEVVAMARSVQSTPTSSTRSGSEVAFVAKRAGDPLDLGALVYAAGHPAILRRLVFAHRACDPITDALARENMGISVNCLAADCPSDTYLAPSCFETGKGMSAASYFRAMVAALRAQGCPGIPEA